MRTPAQHLLNTIWGHDAVRQASLRLLGSGRLPHAILLTGPDGVGKRSLAFALAKAILSAGKTPAAASLSAPSLPRAKRTVPPPPDPPEEDDLFGTSIPTVPEESRDEEPDLFGEVASPVEVSLPPATPSRTAPLPSAPVVSSVDRRTFLGYDDRICRLVESSYPVDFLPDGRPERIALFDLSIVEPPGSRRSILISQVRFLQEIAATPPVEGAFRVVLVFGADTITQDAGNSILKLLEEPPSYLVMILTADRAVRVLPTIKSRCSILPLAPMPQATLAERLVSQEGTEPTLARVAAALAEGRPGIALQILSGGLLERRREVVNARLQTDRFGVVAVPAAASRIAAAGSLDEVLWLLMSFTRDRLVRTLAPNHPEFLVHGDVPELLDSVVPDISALDEEMDRLLAASRFLAHPYVPNQRTVLEEALWA